jgi:hypothetical protein
MKLPKMTLSIAMLMAANLAPLIGVFWFGWDAAIIILVYWTENLITGFYNVLRMITLNVSHPAHHLGKLFAVPFFCIHFGGFCAGHGAILAALFMEENAWEPVSSNPDWPGPLIFVGLLVSVVSVLWDARPDGTEWIVACLMLSHGVSFVYNHFIKKECAKLSMAELMVRPYKRIVVLHVAILAGAVPIMMLGSPTPLLAILVILKIGIDIVLHARSHGRAAAKGRTVE